MNVNYLLNHPVNALGDPIIMGGAYGYSQTKNGFATIITGRLENITQNRVTLHVMSKTEYLYGSRTDRDVSAARTISVSPHILFPLPYRFYRVKQWETLSHIAHNELKSQNRWKEIAELNADQFHGDVGGWEYYQINTNIIIKLPE